MDMKNEFIEFIKEEYGIDVITQPSKTPDTFENIFGTSFIDVINVVDKDGGIVAATNFTDELKNLEVWKALGLREEDFYKE